MKSFASINSGGRLYKEKENYCNNFEEDRNRIISSMAFHRLQYKTQVFVNHYGDHYRNRLTHSIEVASLARAMCERLGLCSELAEDIALAHDLGHTPFGHCGEHILNQCTKDGFSHNTHALKIITELEEANPNYPGLNLSWEVLEGIIKHNGPISSPDNYIYKYNLLDEMDLKNYSSAESQISSLADDITYICHDLQDSVRAKLININQLFDIKILKDEISYVRDQYSNIEDEYLIYLLKKRLTIKFSDNLIENTNKNLLKLNPKTHKDIRNASFAIASKWIKRIENTELLHSVISDYIAGMTDRFAINEYQKHFNISFNEIII